MHSAWINKSSTIISQIDFTEAIIFRMNVVARHQGVIQFFKNKLFFSLRKRRRKKMEKKSAQFLKQTVGCIRGKT